MMMSSLFTPEFCLDRGSLIHLNSSATFGVDAFFFLFIGVQRGCHANWARNVSHVLSQEKSAQPQKRQHYGSKIHPGNKRIWENGKNWIHCWMDFLSFVENFALDVGTPTVVLSTDALGIWMPPLSNQLWVRNGTSSALQPGNPILHRVFWPYVFVMYVSEW